MFEPERRGSCQDEESIVDSKVIIKNMLVQVNKKEKYLLQLSTSQQLMLCCQTSGYATKKFWRLCEQQTCLMQFPILATATTSRPASNSHTFVGYHQPVRLKTSNVPYMYTTNWPLRVSHLSCMLKQLDQPYIHMISSFQWLVDIESKKIIICALLQPCTATLIV